MVGRIQVAGHGAQLEEPAEPVEVADLLQGDNSEEAFAELVRQHATSGVSGVLPEVPGCTGKRLGEKAPPLANSVSIRKPPF